MKNEEPQQPQAVQVVSLKDFWLSTVIQFKDEYDALPKYPMADTVGGSIPENLGQERLRCKAALQEFCTRWGFSNVKRTQFYDQFRDRLLNEGAEEILALMEKQPEREGKVDVYRKKLWELGAALSQLDLLFDIKDGQTDLYSLSAAAVAVLRKQIDLNENRNSAPDTTAEKVSDEVVNVIHPKKAHRPGEA